MWLFLSLHYYIIPWLISISSCLIILIVSSLLKWLAAQFQPVFSLLTYVDHMSPGDFHWLRFKRLLRLGGWSFRSNPTLENHLFGTTLYNRHNQWLLVVMWSLICPGDTLWISFPNHHQTIPVSVLSYLTWNLSASVRCALPAVLYTFALYFSDNLTGFKRCAHLVCSTHLLFALLTILCIGFERPPSFLLCFSHLLSVNGFGWVFLKHFQIILLDELRSENWRAG